MYFVFSVTICLGGSGLVFHQSLNLVAFGHGTRNYGDLAVNRLPCYSRMLCLLTTANSGRLWGNITSVLKEIIVGGTLHFRPGNSLLIQKQQWRPQQRQQQRSAHYHMQNSVYFCKCFVQHILKLYIFERIKGILNEPI